MNLLGSRLLAQPGADCVRKNNTIEAVGKDFRMLPISYVCQASSIAIAPHRVSSTLTLYISAAQDEFRFPQVYYQSPQIAAADVFQASWPRAPNLENHNSSSTQRSLSRNPSRSKMRSREVGKKRSIGEFISPTRTATQWAG